LHGVALVDAPVSGGPRRAADGTMTVMVAGDAAAVAQCEPVFRVTAGRVFRVGTAPGEAAKFKIVNNLLAAVNLAAGAEALALAVRAGLDPQQFVDIVNASSGASWMFADRMPRALARDFAPRAAAKILAKDVGIAAEFAARLGQDAPFAIAARSAFQRLVDAGHGELDDAAICSYWSECAER
jgi:3-hydroxyisobutyrate dehydrogenase-like beta-hydroxyacid dehydrogenase